MKILEEIKDEVAVDYGYENYEDMEQNILFDGNDCEVMPAFDDIAQRYATEAIKADRERVKPDHFFEGDLNERRIKSYKGIAKDYNVSESTIRDIFSLGINFAAANFKNLPIGLQ